MVAEVVDLLIWSSSLVLVAFSLFARWASSRWGFLPAVYIYTIGVASSVLLAAWAYAEPSILLLMALPVGIVSLLIGPWSGFVAAGLTSVILAALPPVLLFFFGQRYLLSGMVVISK